MIVRVVTYGAESMEAARRWMRDRSGDVEGVHGLERVEFIETDHPPRAGAIMYFMDAEDLRQYKDSRRYDELRKSIEEEWADGTGAVRDIVYRVM